MAAEGSDFAGILDIDPAWRTVTGRRALMQAIARRLSTPLGGLADWPGYGFDLRSVIGTSISDELIRQRVREQVLAEEEVEQAVVKVASRDDGLMQIQIAIEDADGPFDLTVNISDLEVTAIIPRAA